MRYTLDFPQKINLALMLKCFEGVDCGWVVLMKKGKEIMLWIAKAVVTEIHLFRVIFSFIGERFIHITFFLSLLLSPDTDQEASATLRSETALQDRVFVSVCVCLCPSVRVTKRNRKRILGYVCGGAFCQFQVVWIVWHSIASYILTRNTLLLSPPIHPSHSS